MQILLVFCLGASLVVGASLPTAAPEEAGFSRDRLKRINNVMQEHIAAGRLNGASGLIARNGKVRGGSVYENFAGVGYNEARQKGIRGRSKMNKAQLRRAVDG
jgi:hypothetical protein